MIHLPPFPYFTLFTSFFAVYLFMLILKSIQVKAFILQYFVDQMHFMKVTNIACDKKNV